MVDSPAPPRPRFNPFASYWLAGIWMFLVSVICCWENGLQQDEEIYFIGPHRIFDPTFLAADFTWSRLSPTTALFDHMLAPLWRIMDPVAIANLGRFTFWALMAWSIVVLARTMKLPAWAAAVGFTVWVLWGQTLGICGTPLEGFQVKSFAYPLMFSALAYAMRGQPGRAGIAAGVGTVFHIIVGGWAFLGLAISMLVNRSLFTRRQLFTMLLAASPFVVGVVLGVGVFHELNVSAADLAKMDQIYVMFAMPHCCDVFYFLSPGLVPLGWIRSAVVFALASVVVLAWPERREAKVLGMFTLSLIAFFIGGIAARALQLNSLLKLYPYQLGNALPALFAFMFVAGWFGVGGAMRRMGRIPWVLALIATGWLIVDREVPRGVIEEVQFFWNEVQVERVLGTNTEEPVFAWIRGNTPRDAVFITPLINEFWPYGERAQVASMRQPPLDHRLIEWKDRLEALNGFQPFKQRGWGIGAELEKHEGALTAHDLVRIRGLYGATHYMMRGERKDLAPYLLHSEDGYSIYDITRLTEPASPS